ncbi:MAG: hypothetical protein JOZ47_21310 [Kutzneria sp.]|nr:hypothetical protein [Kutzneria sp.]
MFTTRLTRAFVASALAIAGAATGSAAAAPAGFAPHTTFGHGSSSFAGGNWGGYASQGDWTTATASWTEPSVTCRSTNDLFAPWVGIDGYGSTTVEQTGVATDCSSGSPVYQAWYEMYPAPPSYYSNPISAGDHFTATVTRTGNSYKLDITDTTKGWTQTHTESLAAQHSSAEAIIESPTDSYPAINGGVTFTGVRFNGQALGSTNPQALDADDQKSGTFHPGPVNGDSFTISRQ